MVTTMYNESSDLTKYYKAYAARLVYQELWGNQATSTISVLPIDGIKIEDTLEILGLS